MARQRSFRRGTYRWRQYSDEQARGDRASVHSRHRADEGAGDHRKGEHSRQPARQRALRLGSAADPRRPSTATIWWRATSPHVAMNIKRLMDLGSYRGLRHRRGLPRPRPAHAHQRAHPQGAVQADRRKKNNCGSSDRWPRDTTRVRKRERKNITSGIAHVNRPSTTRDHHHRVKGNTMPGRRRGPGLQGLAQVDGHSRPDGRRDGGPQSPDHGMRTLEVEVAGPVRPRIALRPLQAAGHDHHHPRRDADPAQRLPAA